MHAKRHVCEKSQKKTLGGIVLLPEINQKQTRENVKKLLDQYHSLRRLAGTQYEQKMTASYSLEPKGSGGISRPVENMVTRKLTAIGILENIYDTFNKLNIEQREILWNHYVECNIGEYKITEKYNVSLQTYYNRLHKTQIAFAEVYNSGELLSEW